MAIDFHTPRSVRSVGKAMLNGLACRCPSCGKGRLFSGYLKVNDSCDTCGEKLSSARADDFPPYIAIFIVGHVLVGWMLHAEMSGPVDPMLYVWTMIPLAIVLPLVMLPSIKGAVIGLQWANFMYGFDPSRQDTSKRGTTESPRQYAATGEHCRYPSLGVIPAKAGTLSAGAGGSLGTCLRRDDIGAVARAVPSTQHDTALTSARKSVGCAEISLRPTGR